MIELTDESVARLARQYYPILRFHERERFFPLLAESWLTTVSDGLWPESPDREARLLGRRDDPRRRGAAFCLSPEPAIESVRPFAGTPRDGDRPVGLNPDVLTQASGLGANVFMSIGGWRPEAHPFAEGDIEYLAQLCSELAAAINTAQEWRPPDQLEPIQPSKPRDWQQQPVTAWQWIPQPPNVTMYCEVTWAGAWARRDTRNKTTNDYGGARDLDHYVAFTYHLLYAARDPGGGGRRREGQWEAITLFFRSETRPAQDDGETIGRNQLIDERPHTVVVSQGRNGDDGFFNSDTRMYVNCERIGERPVIYVTLGSHRNVFTPVSGETYDPGKYGPHAPDTTAHDDEPSSWVGVDDFLVVAGAALGLAVLLVLFFPAAAAIAVLFIAAIILFLMWLVSACDEASDRDAGKSIPPYTEPQETSTAGPQSGGEGTEEAAPAAPASAATAGGGPAGATVGLPNTGSPTGKETSFPDVRIVERLFVDGAVREHTGFPAASTLENPHWWDYRGRWGVQVAPAEASGTWESGSRRVDHFGRDWGYYCGLGMLNAIHKGTV